MPAPWSWTSHSPRRTRGSRRSFGALMYTCDGTTLQVVTGYPPVLSGGVAPLERFWAYLEEIGVADVGAVLVERPNLLGLDVDNNLRKVWSRMRRGGSWANRTCLASKSGSRWECGGRKSRQSVWLSAWPAYGCNRVILLPSPIPPPGNGRLFYGTEPKGQVQRAWGGIHRCVLTQIGGLGRKRMPSYSR